VGIVCLGQVVSGIKTFSKLQIIEVFHIEIIFQGSTPLFYRGSTSPKKDLKPSSVGDFSENCMICRKFLVELWNKISCWLRRSSRLLNSTTTKICVLFKKAEMAWVLQLPK
jgi:hypothetical protein